MKTAIDPARDSDLPLFAPEIPLSAYTDKSMYFSNGRDQTDIIDRDSFSEYWTPRFKKYLIYGYVPRFKYDRDSKCTYQYSHGEKRIVYRDQITGKLCSMQGNYDIESACSKNVYGQQIYTSSENLIAAGFKWIGNLKTYVHRDDLNHLDTCEAILQSGKRGLIAHEIDGGTDDYKFSEYQDIFVHEDQCQEIHGGDDVVSESFYSDNFFTCQGCDCATYNDDHSGDWYCDLCYASNNNVPERSGYDACAVKAYGFYNGKNQGNENRPGARYFGLEIEIELRDTSYVSDLRNDVEEKNLALGCSDGSLSEDCGLEIKTPPLLNGHYHEYLTRLYKVLNEYRYDVNDGTGLHVNVSRASVSNMTLGKLVCFMHHKKNREFITFIAGRDSGRWADFEKLKTIKNDLYKGRYQNCDSKYTAVNVKDDVLEFRIFISITEKDRAVRAIEFCDSVLNYCADQTLEKTIKGGLTHDDFKTWLIKRRNWYPVLSDSIFGKIEINRKENEKCA